jgi:hypothetical protein
MYYEEELQKIEYNLDKLKNKEYRFLGTIFVTLHDTIT